ncbi:MAG: hypothetical protein JSW27_05645 [Phycisphaerales bacterium]|nr:MAG: hypothetical protein JSW27_05645 [Phycisphaerales bacterium]
MDLLDPIARYLFAQSWQIVVLVGVVALICRCLRRHSSHVRYLLWLIVLAKCLTPALLTVPIAVLPHEHAVSAPAPPSPASPQRQKSRPMVVVPVAGSTDESALPGLTWKDKLNDVTGTQWLTLVWLAGVLVFAAITVARAVRMQILLRRDRQPLPAELRAEAEDLCGTLRLAIRPEVWVMPGAGQPFVWGLWRGVIFLPPDFAHLEGLAHRRQILTHEIGHVLRFDAAVNVFQILAQVVLWFHPAVWWMNHRIRVEREKCCDEMAIAQLRARPRDYGKAIVNALMAEHHSRMTVSSLAIAGPIQAIEERIKTIMRPNRRFLRRPARSAALCILALALVAVPTTIALARRSSSVEVLDVRFDPVHQGKNVVYLDVKNPSDETQTFAVHIQTRSPNVGRRGVGWGRPFFTTVPANGTQTLRCAFHIWGPIVPQTWVRLKFYNPASEEAYDYEQDFAMRRYTGSDLPVAGQAAGQSVSAEVRKEIVEVFRRFQSHLRERQYEQAWNLLTMDHRDAAQIQTLKRFIEQMEPARGFSMFYWNKEPFLKLSPQAVRRTDVGMEMIATGPEGQWTITFVQADGKWEIDWIDGYLPWVIQTQNWEQRILPTMERRATDHFDIHYFADSTAAKQIDQIVRRREDAFKSLCELLKVESGPRIRFILFQDKASKLKATGHQGAGWAYGNTIVEVYNEDEHVDPYHETAHIVMGQFGDPPAMFNEGFAVHMQEGHRWNGQPVDETATGLLKEDRLVPLATLLMRTEIGARDDDGEVAYPQSGSFVGFLIKRYGQDRFLKVYGALKRSGDPQVHQANLRAIEEVYGQTLAQLEREWKAILSEQ